MLKQAAALHRNQFLKFLSSTGRDVVVYQPPAKDAVTDDASKVFGSQEDPDEYGTSTTIKAIVSDVLAGATSFPDDQQFPVGVLYESEVVIRLNLEDILLDITQPRGKTIVDTAKAIEIDGEFFERVGKPAKTGLPPIGPYIYWAGLRKLD